MVISDSKTFGEALKKRRKELGYTQRYISEFTGFSISFIPDWKMVRVRQNWGKLSIFMEE